MIVKSHNARGIAEALWGRGGTTSYRCTRKGAWWFSCSSHGGMILTVEALSNEETEKLVPFSDFLEVRAWFDAQGRQRVFWHPYRSRTAKIRTTWTEKKTSILIFEEDAAWAIPGHLLGIFRADFVEPEIAKKSFSRYYDPANQVVQKQKSIDQRRTDGCPDLIISATRKGTNKTDVTTADGKKYIVSGYNAAFDEYGYPWLSKCKEVEAQC